MKVAPSMDFRARLVHADATGRVVLVSAFEGERCLGSALGEATTAEEAEDRAQERLRLRFRHHDHVGRADPPRPPAAPPAQRELAADPSLPSSAPAGSPPPPAGRSPKPREESRRPPTPDAPQPTQQPLQLQQPLQPQEPLQPHEQPAPQRIGQPQHPLEPPTDPPPLSSLEPASEPTESAAEPEDWSADLLRLDALLGTLGWGREQERVYLQRLFGQASRSRLTRYADLMVLRRALEAVPPGSAPDTAPLPILRRDLLAQCDDLLGRLAWTTERARQWLEAHFAVSSRQRLSDDQLLAFNLLLEGELLAQTEIGGAGRCLELPSASKDTSLS